jgi:putative endonuclease
MSSNPTWFVYIVKCSDGSFYTGISNNLEHRLRQHNGEIVGGAFYTRNKRPVKLIYTEEYGTHLEAARREVEIKKMTRAEKVIIVEKGIGNKVG